MFMRPSKSIGFCVAFGGVWLGAFAFAGDELVEKSQQKQSTGGFADQSAVRASNEFAIDLYRKLAATEGRNVFFSPRSIESVLGILRSGAGGTTWDEISRVLHVVNDRQGGNAGPVDSEVRQWGRLSRAGEGYEVTSATHLWGGRDVPFSKSFLNVTAKRLGAELTLVDFSEATAVRDQINNWVSEKTHGQIRSILSRPPDPATTKLLAVNAVFFKADWGWKEGFSKKRTTIQPFYVPNKALTVAKIPMMSTYLKTRAAVKDGVQILELPYAGKEFSAFILIPKWESEEGLTVLQQRTQAMEHSLSAEKLSGWLEDLPETGVSVELPRFEVSETLELREILAGLGMRAAFGSDADFSKMAEGPLYVSDVAHRAIIEVNEEGTTAGGTTQAVVRSGGQFVRVNHPFLYLIRDTRDGSILFLGRIADLPGKGR